MIYLEQSHRQIEITQCGRHVEVKTPTVEMSCDLPVGCSVQGHGCQVHFLRLPLQCDLSPYDIMRDAFIGINTMPSEQTRRFLHQYDENGWQVKLGRTRVNLYTDEVRDVCMCLDAIGQRYALVLSDATNQLDAWHYPQAMARGKAGVRIVSVHLRIWQLMQQFAHEFSSSGKGGTIWHCFGSTHNGEAVTVKKPEGPLQATLWALPHETYYTGEYVPLLYEYPDSELLAHEEQVSRPWQLLGMSAVWTATQAEQWVTSALIPQLLTHYQVRHNGPWTEPSGIRYRLAQTLAPDVFNYYREGITAVRTSTYSERGDERTPIEQIDKAEQFIPYIEDLHQWLATYPVSRLKAENLRPYYAVIADFAKYARPQIVGLCALRDMFEEMEHSSDSAPKATGWRLLTSSFEAFSASLAQQVRRVNENPYEYTTCADLLTLAFLHILERGRNQGTSKLIRLTKEAISPLWRQAQFDERYVLKPTAA